MRGVGKTKSVATTPNFFVQKGITAYLNDLELTNTNFTPKALERI